MVSIYDKVLYSDICIQDIRSKKCGEFCIAFINKVNSIMRYERFIKYFDESEMYLNDFIVHDFLKKHKSKNNKIKKI